MSSPDSKLIDLYPIHCQPVGWDQVEAALQEIKQRYERGGGENLRMEWKTTIVGGRLTVIFDWEDM